ncbi:hypothetical protein NLX83_39575 [Allokutzneria sp. A3M-2-11 16]|uniref:hypothetical protein n=1 Tax=Allokutzneria sp. A3M-2-11 16 TaxID=2962043 RepID=UPI0020B7456A|nr:hypothetical protein [Allokutzneria sp. A3M-2-11 16]MCP3805385.1 hypothetical protein [Allokutzneria sp. A3M-2-11 16]
MAHEALSALALKLARQLDDGAGLATAAVSRELRACLDALCKDGGASDPDELHELVGALSTPVGDIPHP